MNARILRNCAGRFSRIVEPPWASKARQIRCTDVSSIATCVRATAIAAGSALARASVIVAAETATSVARDLISPFATIQERYVIGPTRRPSNKAQYCKGNIDGRQIERRNRRPARRQILPVRTWVDRIPKPVQPLRDGGERLRETGDIPVQHQKTRTDRQQPDVARTRREACRSAQSARADQSRTDRTACRLRGRRTTSATRLRPAPKS